MTKSEETYLVDGRRIAQEECRKIFAASRLNDRQLQVMDMVEGDHIVDIGCYAGNFVAELARRFPTRKVEGIDYFEDHVAIARLVFPDIAANFRQMSIYDLQFADASLDCVTLQEVLEHLEGAATAVKEINRVLRSGGALIVSVPNPYGITAMFSFFRFEIGNAWRRFRGGNVRLGTEVYFEEVEWNRHIFSWTPQTLLTLFAVNGFEYVKHSYENAEGGLLVRILSKLFPFLGPTQILKVRKVHAASSTLV